MSILKINKERAVYIAAVSQMLGAAQFGYFAFGPLSDLFKLKGLPASLETVIISTVLYMIFFALGYYILSDRFTKEVG